MIFDEILGNDELKKSFLSSFTAQKASHAYLIEGQSGSGRFRFACLMATCFVCNEKNPPCLTCTNCKKALSLIHPDIFVVEAKKGKESISIEQIRTVTHNLHVLPNEGKKKVYIIRDAQKMTAQAQNALLKAIEEPPSFCVFILTVSSKEEILPVILSRTARLYTRPVSKEVLTAYLKKEYSLSNEDALFYASVSCGNVGTAKNLIEENKIDAYAKVFDGCIRGQREKDQVLLLKGIELFESQKENFSQLCELFLLYIRDVAAVKSEFYELYYPKYQKTVEETAQLVPFGSLLDLSESINRAKDRIKANGNYSLTIFSMLFGTWEE